MDYSNYFKQYPDDKGEFDSYGGAYLPPPLEPVDLYGIEPLGRGTKLGEHAAAMEYGKPGVGPEHCMLKDIGRVNYAGYSVRTIANPFQQKAKIST